MRTPIGCLRRNDGVFCTSVVNEFVVTLKRFTEGKRLVTQLTKILRLVKMVCVVVIFGLSLVDVLLVTPFKGTVVFVPFPSGHVRSILHLEKWCSDDSEDEMNVVDSQMEIGK